MLGVFERHLGADFFGDLLGIVSISFDYLGYEGLRGVFTRSRHLAALSQARLYQFLAVIDGLPVGGGLGVGAQGLIPANHCFL